MIFSINTKCNSFILKCFIQFACTNLDGSQKKGINFLNLLQKEDGTQKEGASLRKDGVPTLEETVCFLLHANQFEERSLKYRGEGGRNMHYIR